MIDRNPPDRSPSPGCLREQWIDDLYFDPFLVLMTITPLAPRLP